MPIDKDEFRAALSRFASGVTVVTTKDTDGNLHGLTVSAFCSVSLEPPLILICIDKHTASHNAFQQSNHFVVNVLHEEQIHYSNQFAAPIADKFDGIAYHLGIEGIPVLADALVNLECRLVNAHDDGDHTIFVGQIEKSHTSDGKPLVYFYGDYRTILD